jgi:hypothetical protein
MDVNDHDLTPEELLSVDRAMEIVGRFPRGAVDNMIRHVVRSAVYYRRTRDLAVLESVAKSVLGTIRMHRDSDDMDLLAKQHTVSRQYVDTEEVLAALES